MSSSRLFTGTLILMGGLRARGFRIQTKKLRDYVRRVDPWGMLDRWSAFIPVEVITFPEQIALMEIMIT